MVENIKRRDGFEGEKLISLPDTVWKKNIKTNPILGNLYITHIGYFPKAAYHYRERRNGCADNILVYCLRGKGWYSVKGRRFDVGVNQFFIIPATKEHLRYGADAKDPWTIYWVHFSSTDMQAFNSSFEIGLYDGPKEIIFNEKGLELWHSMFKSLEMGYSKENLSKANLCLYHFISTFLYPHKYADEKRQLAQDLINESILFMRAKLANKLTVDDLARRNNMSASHFTYLFRKGTGMPPLDYFIHLKLQKACLLLGSTDNKIKNVAADIGYDDPYYFSRLFKKYMNVSPEQYRLSRRHQPDENE